MFLRHQVLDDIDNFSEGGIKGIGCRKKVSQMRWCLAEAQRDRYRAALLSATTVTLKQDKRKGPDSSCGSSAVIQSCKSQKALCR